MKLSLLVAEIISEFHGIQSKPTYRTERKTSIKKSCEKCAEKDRRHSVMITVGVDDVPVVTGHFAKKDDPRRKSAPCFSSVASSTSLKDKMRRAANERPRSASVSYRVLQQG